MRRRGKKRKRVYRYFLLLLCIVCAVGIGRQVFFSGQFPGFTRTADESAGWNLMLVNSRYHIPSGYEPELIRLSNGEKVDARIYPELQEMFDNARMVGYGLFVRAGYRSGEEQQELMEDKISDYEAEGYSSREARRLAKKWVAEPGTSEHELGFAVDINGKGQNADSLYQWLSENSWKYGFILRYPEDKKEITGIDYEPWHFRYVGKKAAKVITQKGICLEEYLEKR